MDEDGSTEVWVNVAVSVGGVTKTFPAETTTAANGWRVAEGLLGGLENDAQEWLRERRRMGSPL